MRFAKVYVSVPLPEVNDLLGLHPFPGSQDHGARGFLFENPFIAFEGMYLRVSPLDLKAVKSRFPGAPETTEIKAFHRYGIRFLRPGLGQYEMEASYICST